MARPRRIPDAADHIKPGDIERRHNRISEREQIPSGVAPPKPMTNGSGANTPLPDVDYSSAAT